MFKNLTAIIAGTLIALATGPAFAQGQNVGQDLLDLGENLTTLQETVDNLQNLSGPKTIFLSSSTHDGNLGGLEGADAICQGLADASLIVPEGEYVALMGDDGVTAAARLTPSSGPYIRPDGLPVVANFAALFGTLSIAGPRSRDLINRIRITDQGDKLLAAEVWTGIDFAGTSSIFNCGNWFLNDGAVSGEFGTTFFKRERYLTADSDNCDDVSKRLYCVQR